MNKSLCTPLLPQSLSENNSSNTLYHTRRKKEKKKLHAQSNMPLATRLQSKRVLRRLAVPSNPLATRQILVLNILLVALPLVGVSGDILHAFGCFAVGAADGACDVADGGSEGFVERLADGVADNTEETLSHLLSVGGRDGERGDGGLLCSLQG